MYKAFIEPDLQTAHIKIMNKFNPFNGFQNPTYILKVNFQLSPELSFQGCILSTSSNILASTPSTEWMLSVL